MKELYILRHADAASPAPAIDDHERALTSAGTKAAQDIAAEFARRVPILDLVLCSTAQRAVDTYKIVQQSMPNGILVEFDRAYYLSTVGRWMERLRHVEDDIGNVLVVGHNPGLHQLLLQLCRGDESEPMRRLARHFAPAALAHVELEIDRWSGLAPGTGRLRFLMSP